LRVVKLVLQTRTDPTYSLQPPDSAASRKPDLADFFTHEVWEVKPASQGAAAAVRQLGEFLALLRQADREYDALSRQQPRYASQLFSTFDEWHPGAELDIPPLTVAEPVPGIITFTCPAPGALLWEHHATKP
jgi:hypothetical protein